MKRLHFFISCIVLTKATCAFCPDVLLGRPSTFLNAALSNRKRKGPRFTQTVHNKGRSAKSDSMWRNNKSIEQLEEKLSFRWGTDLNTWTARDGDFDDEDDDAWNDPSIVVAEEAPNFRATPVLDPWEEKKQKAADSRKKTDKSTRILLRAQANQARIRKDKVQPQNEYYDEDDMGFEPKNRDNTDSDLVVDDLISPKPVGGQGTFNSEPEGNFFFRRPSEVNPQKAESSIDLEEDPKLKRPARKERAASIPLLDEDGNPVLLTLEQAEREFEKYLVAAGVDPDDYYKEKEELTNRYVAKDSQRWEDLGITSDVLLENLSYMGCETPLAVQSKTCPPVTDGKDVMVGTYTGSGKTLSFLVPVIQQILDAPPDASRNVNAIIVAPGRELASQIVSVARELLEGTDLSVMLSIGGTTFKRNLEQIRKRKPTIIVGTPGRIAELVVGQPGEKSGRLKISGVKHLVLDECDALLEYKPHRDPTKAVLSRLKQQSGANLQLIMCSATMSHLVGSNKLEGYVRDDAVVAMADADDVMVTSGKNGGKSTKGTRVSKTVMHGVVHVPHRRLALENLRRILHTEPVPQQILIFVENSRKVKIVVEKLEQMGIIAAPLHGGFGSEKTDRSEVSKALREGYVGIVVATELAARGLDAPLLSHVVNLDLPTDASHYAHRAGRCGRGGRPGVVINFTTSPQERNVPQRFADALGVEMFAVEPKNGKLNIVDGDSQDLD